MWITLIAIVSGLSCERGERSRQRICHLVRENSQRQPRLIRKLPWRVSGQFRKSQGNVRTARYHIVKRARKRSRVLTWENVLSTLRRLDDRRKEFLDEADVSAEYAPTEEDARLPGAHEHAGWTKSVEAAAREGTQAAHRLAAGL
jgi:hypothetical protein